MNGQVIYDTKEKITDKGVKNSNVKLIPKGTTLLSFKLSIGKTAVAGKDLYTNEAIAALIPFDLKKLSNDYLFQYFNGNVLDASSVGKKAFGKSLNSAYLKTEMQIPLPPLDVQKSIVAECEQVDSEYQNAQNDIADCKAKITKIIANETGVNKKLKDICDMKAGKFVSADDISPVQKEGMYPCFGGNGLRGYVADFTHDGVYPLVGRQGALCGNVCMATGKFHATEHAVAVTPKENIDVYWLRYQLEFMNLNQYSTGTAQPGLSVNKIVEVSCTVPPLAKQQEIVSKITALESKIADGKKVMEECPVKKQQILDKWLK